jgi:hypothetical protein
MDNSTVLPRAPSAETTTPLFSRTSRSLRPRQRTTTFIFVSSLPSFSKSRSFRFVPAVSGDLGRLKTEAFGSAGDAAPFLLRDACLGGASELALAVDDRTPFRRKVPDRGAAVGTRMGPAMGNPMEQMIIG